MTERLTLNLSAPPPIPEAGIAAAEAVLRAGWTHRYGETMGDASKPPCLKRNSRPIWARVFVLR